MLDNIHDKNLFLYKNGTGHSPVVKKKLFEKRTVLKILFIL